MIKAVSSVELLWSITFFVVHCRKLDAVFGANNRGHDTQSCVMVVQHTVTRGHVTTDRSD